MGDELSHVILSIFKVILILFLTKLLRSCLFFRETMLLVPRSHIRKFGACMSNGAILKIMKMSR
jgi:hypothetical protein